MIEIDGITVRGCISFDRSKKDTSSSGKVTWHKRWEAEAGYYGVAFRKRSKHRAILEDFLLDLHQLDKDGLLKEICIQTRNQSCLTPRLRDYFWTDAYCVSTARNQRPAQKER